MDPSSFYISGGTANRLTVACKIISLVNGAMRMLISYEVAPLQHQLSIVIHTTTNAGRYGKAGLMYISLNEDEKLEALAM